ncbi:MAG: acetyl-CoA carboxylase biotin carboxyl carrier protein subunit [Candidatus Paceibacterota bacterium]|jgi:biotin carboxyl carrier protein|nr:acetyl-CoA carboxylase biotin carboxyl carrier protein subunit [bacterium]
MNFNIKIKERIYSIRILEKGKGGISINIEGKSFDFDSVKCSDEKCESISDFGQDQKILLQKELKASIAGIVSEIFVKEGDSIKQGQKILTLLAMKMENEIIAEGNGKIKKILVLPNQTVRENETLIIFV